MDEYLCPCGKLFKEEDFSSHYKKCPEFKMNFKDFDLTIGNLFTKYSNPKRNLVTVKFLLKEYINVIDQKLKNYFKSLGINTLETEKKENKINDNNKNNQNEIISLMKKLEIKEDEIKKLKSIIPNDLKEGEKLLPLIFVSRDQNIHYSIICKDTDKFNYIENKLYDIYPQYQENENYFTVNGYKINKTKTIQENKIKYSDIIMLIPYESEQ